MSNPGLDVVLVNPGNRSRIYQRLGEGLAAVEPPVWAGLMAAYLRRKGFSVHVLDADALELDAAETARRVLEMKPILAAVVVYGHQPSASTQTMPAAGAICTAIKQADPMQKILLLGGHVAALPERTLQEEAADFVGGGEGPVTLWELLQALTSNGSGDLARVRGLWYREGTEVQWNPPAGLVNDLNGEMPEMAWDLLPMDQYRAHNWHCFGGVSRQPYASLYTTLGCPFHCSFCCIQTPFKSGEGLMGYKASINSYRAWSPEVVVAQIDTLVTRYGVRNLKIADEMYVLNPAHVLGLCEKLIERGYDLNIWAYARVDTVRDGMLEKLKKAGFNWLAFGIESANPRVRDDVRKGYAQEEIFRTLEKVRSAGIHVIGNYIFGLPEDDLETMGETLSMASELNCEFANFYCAMAYPGSSLYAEASKEGWLLPESWGGYSQHAYDSLPLPTRYLLAAEVLRFRDQAFQAYFSSPRYLSMVEKKFGSQTAREIREMTAVSLPRKLEAHEVSS